MDFAVRIPGMEEGRASWVLAVDGDRLLLSAEDGVLTWHSLADCILVKAATPDQPTLVLPVQMQPQNQVVIPNRAMRRENGRN